MTVFYVYLDNILIAFGATEYTLSYAREYLQIVLIGNVFISLCYSFNNMMRASGVAVLLNTSLLKHGGDLVVGAYGILNSMLLIIIMTVVGLNQGTQPIVGYNYGAKNFLRVKDTFYYTVKIATIIMSTGFIIGMFFLRQFAGAFTNDQALLDIAENGIRLSLIAFPLVGFQVVAGNFFQSIGQAKKPLFRV